MVIMEKADKWTSVCGMCGFNMRLTGNDQLIDHKNGYNLLYPLLVTFPYIK